MQTAYTVSTYLIKKLHECGVKHIFGVPGDYVLGVYDQLVRTKTLEVINTCDELAAAFAADAYARVRGLGVVCVTYCVGGLKVVNATAQAYAEKSPIVVISGAPGTKERTRNPLLRHSKDQPHEAMLVSLSKEGLPMQVLSFLGAGSLP
jgi:TPP-dependent 2-oxoacid decarboxylase